MPTSTSSDDTLKFTAEIVTAYVSNNSVASADIPALIEMIYSCLQGLGNKKQSLIPSKPAVPIKKSFTEEYIICLEDGKKLKMLKRYLRSHYGMTPEEYRAKWGLPADYPMVAPAYASKRSEFAKKIGLGKKR